MFIGNTFVGHKLNGKRVEKRERQGDEIDFDWDPHSLSQRYIEFVGTQIMMIDGLLGSLQSISDRVFNYSN